MTNQLDLLVIGDVCIDLYLKVEDKDVATDKHSSAPKICFYHGSKIPVKSLKTNIAGNAINVAVGATILNMKSAIYTEMGDDEYADKIIHELNKYNIDTSLMHKNKNAQTGLHPVIVYAGDRTIFSHHEIRHYKVSDKWPQAKWMYYTSVSPGFENFQKDLIAYLEKNSQIGVAFNPGTYHLKLGLDGIRNFLKVTDVLFVNQDEAEMLVGSHPLEELHRKLYKLGPKLTIITLGENGSSGYDGQEFIKIKSYKIDRPVVDRTGAGDAFAIGVVAALNYKKNLREALWWGAINSSSVIRDVGAIHGLLPKQDIEKIIKSLI